MKRISVNCNPPTVVEHVNKNGTVTWLLSFNGSNPDASECIKLSEDDCFWLYAQILNINLSSLSAAKQKGLLYD